MKAFQIIVVIFCLPLILLSQNRYDVVIDEIMADPTPQVGLPNNEWIELKNITISPINLLGWRIGDATGQSGPLPNFILQPDSFVIVCSVSALATMSLFGTAISVTSLPSLDNDGDQLFLRAANSRTIHAVSYSISWYENELKKEGGWTLEMIDTKSPCAAASNWKASINILGGTPGKKNSVDAVNPDQTGPKLKYSYVLDSITIVSVFDEPVDSFMAATPANYNIDGGISVASAATLSPLFNTVQLKLSTPLSPGRIYNLVAANITDCKSNIIENANSIKLGLPIEPMPLDMVINEILFNPRSNGYDYIEFYNQSNKIFDVSKLYVANRNSSGAISSIKQVLSLPFYIFPGDYIVVTENATSLEINYLVKNQDAVFVISSLPSYPDDEGDVILLNGQGRVLDEVRYKDDWHFKLINDAEGVSLERIDPAGPSQDPTNWHSAASTAGYGTPTYKNSQYRQTQIVDATIAIAPKIFSPDNDGNDDIITIQYKLSEPGYIGNITIFDALGRPIRYLVKNGTLGLRGHWNWDGLDDSGLKLPVATYIIYTEIFNLKGKKKQFKNAVVLAGILK